VPELPETETIARDLQAAIVGATISRTRVVRADVLRSVSPVTLSRRCNGAKVVRCWRRAKIILIDLDTGFRIAVQPRFTGALLIDQEQVDSAESKYTAIEWTFTDGRHLRYRDVRRLGTVALMSPSAFAEADAALGAEPLDERLSADRFSALVRAPGQAIKKVLMDQRVVAGVGNIYATEALWLAGIDPSRVARTVSGDEAARLFDALRGVLTAAIAARGTSFRDYRDASGGRGQFVAQLRAYGRAGLPCPRCGHRLIGTHAIDGRATVFCARCQR
jgi:formamidopyrimidine-DNA glycosylase